jgi:transposase
MEGVTYHLNEEEETVMNITTVGLDLAKNVFHLVGLDAHGREQMKKRLARGQVLKHFANSPACLIGMEACASSHHFARELGRLGHEVRLIPPQYVKAYLRGQKNDYNDARAIAEAVRVPSMRFVTVKTVEQQDVQSLVRLREGAINGRTACANRIRGLLGEYGLVMGKSLSALRRALPEILEDARNGLTEVFRRVLNQEREHLLELDAHIDRLTTELTALSKQDDRVVRLQTAPGYGPIVASVFVSVMGDGAQHRRGREASASIGLVPRQHSSGGKHVLLGISKRGDRYLRSLLIHGARAVVNAAQKKDDPLSRWINRLRETRGMNKATVALANKLARIGWAILRNGTTYQPVPA